MLHFPLDKLQLFLITVLLLIVVLYLFLDGQIFFFRGLFAVPDRDNDDDINAVQFINEDTDEVLATVSNKRLEKAVDVKVNLIGVDKLRVKAGRISDDNNFKFGYNGGYLYNLYLTPITQK